MDPKVVWITGGSKGIGKAIAESLVKQNYYVVISSRNEADLKSTANNLSSSITKCVPITCDVSDEESVQKTFNKILDRFNRIDVLINGAGTGFFQEIIDTTLDQFIQQLNTNLIGTFLCSKYVVNYMKENKQGHIINIVSVAAIKAFTNSGTYGATKAAVLMLSKVLREEVKKYNIKVTAVIPGATLTDIWNPKIIEKYANAMIKPEDIAEAVLSIIRQSNSVITEEVVLRPMQGDLNY